MCRARSSSLGLSLGLAGGAVPRNHLECSLRSAGAGPSPLAAELRRRLRFVRYRAASARDIRCSGVSAGSRTAIPKLASTNTGDEGWVLAETAAARRRETRSASRRDAPGRTTPNSSPPRRYASSVRRSSVRSASARSRRAVSPASCPKLSLSSLRLSMSQRISAKLLSGWAASRASRAMNARRFGRPVSVSCMASCRSRTAWSAV